MTLIRSFLDTVFSITQGIPSRDVPCVMQGIEPRLLMSGDAYQADTTTEFKPLFAFYVEDLDTSTDRIGPFYDFQAKRL